MADPWTRKEIIGDCTLYLGDCLQVMPTLGRFDAVVTDPPYGIAYHRGGGGGKFGINAQVESLPVIKGDDQPFDPAPLLALGVPTIMWGANHYAERLPSVDRWLIWDKRCGVGSNDFADCEMAWTNIGGPARVFNHMWNGIIRHSERGIPRVHKTQKAIAVMEWCLGFLPKAQTILDPFMGSGTTLVACQRMGRHGTGIELDPDYFEIACKRVRDAYAQPDLFIAPPEKPIQEELL